MNDVRNSVCNGVTHGAQNGARRSVQNQNQNQNQTFSTAACGVSGYSSIHNVKAVDASDRLAWMAADAAVLGGEIDARADLGDLDLLDDGRRHARCCICTGTYGDLIGVPFVAICGQRAINLRAWDHPEAFPPDACPECVALFDQPCPKCGA